MELLHLSTKDGDKDLIGHVDMQNSMEVIAMALLDTDKSTCWSFWSSKVNRIYPGILLHNHHLGHIKYSKMQWYLGSTVNRAWSHCQENIYESDNARTIWIPQFKGFHQLTGIFCSTAGAKPPWPWPKACGIGRWDSCQAHASIESSHMVDWKGTHLWGRKLYEK